MIPPQFPLNPEQSIGRGRRCEQILARLDGQDNITFLDIGAKSLSPDGSIAKEIMGDYLHPT